MRFEGPARCRSLETASSGLKNVSVLANVVNGKQWPGVFDTFEYVSGVRAWSIHLEMAAICIINSTPIAKMKLFLAALLAVSAQAAGTIVDIAIATPDLSTLVAAVKAGGLVNTLSSPGPFTVFAPTNEAFSALPAGVVANLLKPENKAQLDDVLTYHVVSGAVHAKDLSDGESVKTVEGKTLAVSVSAKGVFINNAQVTTADVDASNGVVHIINAVLLPKAAPTPAPAAPTPAPAGKTIVELAVATPDLSTLVTALKAAGLVDTLSGKGQVARSL